MRKTDTDPLDTLPYNLIWDGRNQLDAESVGTATGLNSFMSCVSPSRLAMEASHTSQMLVLHHGQPNRCMSTVEPEYAKATFNISMPCNARIIKVMEMFPQQIGGKSADKNDWYVIYENMDKKEKGIQELGVLILKSHFSQHQNFGFKYVELPTWNLLKHNTFIRKGTIFSQSPSVMADGNYAYGRNANTVMMPLRQCIEDGVVARAGWLTDMSTTAMGDRMVGYGSNSISLNTYGTLNEHKAHPNMHEHIRDDGLLFGSRDYDPLLAAVNMHRKALMDFDDCFDRLQFAEPEAEIIELEILGNTTQNYNGMGETITAQQQQYAAMQHNFNTQLLKLEREYTNRNPDILLTPELTNLLVRANDFVSTNAKPVQRSYRTVPLDQWTIRFKYAYTFVPGIGSKITDLSGGKSIIVAIWPDEDMPTDKFGTVADIIVDNDSTLKRNNPSRPFFQWVNATSDQITRDIRRLSELGRRDEIWPILKRYYQFSDDYRLTADEIEDFPDELEKHIDHVLENGVSIAIPTNNDLMGVNLIEQMNREFPLDYGPVTFRRSNGKMGKTKENIIISSIYTLLLEKIGASCTSVASAKRQNLGVLAKINPNSRYGSPIKKQATRLLGETEGRIVASIEDPEYLAMELDFANSPFIQRKFVEAIYSADKPMAIDEIIPYDRVQLGTSRPKLQVDNTLMCSGVELRRDFND